MKDKILEIIDNSFEPITLPGIGENKTDEGFIFNRNKSATEIADMVKAFVEWLIIEQEIFMGELSEKYIINDNIHVNGKRLETLDELFDYWYTNIREK